MFRKWFKNGRGKRDWNPRSSPWQGIPIKYQLMVMKGYQRLRRLIIQRVSFRGNSDRTILTAMESNQRCTRRGGEVVARNRGKQRTWTLAFFGRRLTHYCPMLFPTSVTSLITNSPATRLRKAQTSDQSDKDTPNQTTSEDETEK